jgi:outer membrane protein assembly factor BamA
LSFNRYIKKCIHPAIPILVAVVMASCSPTRYVPENSYLLSRSRLETSQNNPSKDQLQSYIIQKPNKKLLGIRFHLFLYDLSNINKTKWPHAWLRKIGEEPSIYSPDLTKTSLAQLKQYLEDKGYYHAQVYDTVIFKGRNAKVKYTINPNAPYHITKISYSFEDTSLASKILPDTLNSLLRRGMRFDKPVLQQERIRIEAMLKELGYFRFSKEYIFYNATVRPEDGTVSLEMNVKEFVEGEPDPRTKIKMHPRYRIGDVNIIPNFSNTATSGNVASSGPVTFDTTRYQNLRFLYHNKSNLRPSIIAYNNEIHPGAYYKLSNVNRTYRNLSELNIVRFTNITFREKDTLVAPGSDKYLDCRIELTQKKLQSYQTEIAGTNSTGDLGVRGNLLYQNLNLFRGAEVFNMKITGAIESLEKQTKGKFRSMKEIGIESSILFPIFLSPIKFQNFVSRHAPKTSLSTSLNYQSRPDFTRSIANASYAYTWNGGKHLTWTLCPIELNYIQIFESHSSSEFLDSIKTTPLGYSFTDHVINVARYGFELNNQTIGKSKDFIFMKFNIESAGNILNLVDKNINKDSEVPRKLFKVPYFQYMRSDVDFRYYNIIDKNNRFAYRIFVGAGYPYGNSKTLPYEKKYYVGGPNSIRAWSTRDLGPGSYVEPDSVSSLYNYPNKSGDIKIEANMEYRFKVIWKMESALFIDAGNVWEINKDVNKPGAEFNFNRFYKEIAVGSGFGLRFDFSYFLLRLDFGIKLRDPADGWIPVFNKFGLRDLHAKFGIGYPF